MNIFSFRDLSAFVQDQPSHIQLIVFVAIIFHSLLLGAGIIFYFTSRPTKKKKRVAFLECCVGLPDFKWVEYESEFQNYIQKNLNMDCITFNMVKGSPKADALMKYFDGVIIGGSPASSNDDAKWIQNLEQLIRVLASNPKFPILGTCFGHQLIAKALGGEVSKSTKGFTLKIEKVTFDEDFQKQKFAIQEQCVSVLQSHGDVVSKLPERAISLAHSPTAKHEFFYRAPNILCHQGHPEISNYDGFTNILPFVLDSLPDAESSEHSLRHQSPTTAAFAKIQRNFFDQFN